MSRRLFFLAVLLFMVFPSFIPGQQPQPVTPGTLIVHEWGTFLSVQGSDGNTLGGMVESDENLPGFVLSRNQEGWERSVARKNYISKMETPVTYFYTDRPRLVQFEASMPQGLLTHWYPSIRSMQPDFQKGEKLSLNQGSKIDFGRFWIHPESTFVEKQKRSPVLPKTNPNDPWLSMRQPDSAIVSFATGLGGNNPKREEEKFLFYRGLGTVAMPMRVTSSGYEDQLELHLHNTSKQPLQGLFLVEVRDNSIRWTAVKDLKGEGTVSVRPENLFCSPMPLVEGIPYVKQTVARALVQSGLFPKEAQAMVDHWQKSYFTTPGLRILYLLPQEETDAQIPIKVSPKPTELVRTMVARLEIITPDTERKLVRLLEEYQKGKTNRTELDALLKSYGRFQEPLLRRIVSIQSSSSVSEQAEALLKEYLASRASEK